MLQSNNNIFFSFNDNLDLYVKRRKNRDLFSSKIVETHPIVLKLVEFGYDEVYSRRVFYYLHPEDIEEALNYMSEDNGIIQHRFIQDRRDIFSNKCYICGAHEKFHLKELDMSINKDNNDIEEINNNLIDEQEEKIIDENNSIENDINNYNNNIINTTNAYFEDKGDKSIISSKNDIRTKKVLLNINNYKKEINHENKNIEKKPNNLMKRLIIYKKINSNKNTLEQKEEKEENLEKMECEVCSEEFIITEKNKVNSCGHAFCDGCWFDSLSVKIKENKISSLKCLDYNCKEKLDDNFIINLLNNDANLINNYIKYKLELLILNDPNKKLCPHPNCDSYLELKNIKNKNVSCLNNHKYCFICLKKPHGDSPCDIDNDSNIKEYAKNNFVKRCPNCGIIIEKNNGCNHITCSKCGHQWCWLCNEKYFNGHFDQGKCKGFQYFQPKNDYEIKLVMEGKIKKEELPVDQIQDFIMDINNEIENHFMPFENINRIEDNFYNINNAINIRPNAVNDNNSDLEYNDMGVLEKFLYVLLYFIFGHFFYFKSYTKKRKKFFILFFYFYLLYTIAFFMQLIIMNIIIFIVGSIKSGFRTFFVQMINFDFDFRERILIIIFYFYLGTSFYYYSLCRKKLFYQWLQNMSKNLLNSSSVSSSESKIYCCANVLMFFYCAFISIIYYPYQIIINSLSMIAMIIIENDFDDFIIKLKKVLMLH